MAELFYLLSEIFKAMLEHCPLLPRPKYAFERDVWTSSFVVCRKISQNVPGLVLLTLVFVTNANLIVKSMFGRKQINDNTQQCVWKIIITLVKYGRSSGNKFIALLELNKINSVECSVPRSCIPACKCWIMFSKWSELCFMCSLRESIQHFAITLLRFCQLEKVVMNHINTVLWYRRYGYIHRISITNKLKILLLVSNS